jgi:hypothetical protein
MRGKTKMKENEDYPEKGPKRTVEVDASPCPPLWKEERNGG